MKEVRRQGIIISGSFTSNRFGGKKRKQL